MPIELLSILRCLGCSASLHDDGAGGYVCSRCARRYPSSHGVARFVDTDNYAQSFGFQWHLYDRTQLDTNEMRRSEHQFLIKTCFTPQDLQGKLVLDVGCGMGRFAEVATRWGARVVGIDLSAAAEVAARNLADRDFCAIQADVFALPFLPESFDVIYSLGVLHHTPDCEQAFRALPKYLKPGGSMAIWVYSGHNKWYRFSDLYRHLTHRMSPPSLHALLRVAVPVLYSVDRGLRIIPLVGKPVAGLVHYVFPVSRNPDPEIRILDTFDWYSPKYQSKHTYHQVFRWFEGSGIEDLHVGEISVSVRGRKLSA